MGSNMIRNIRGGSVTWWVTTVASGCVMLFALGYALVTARSLLDVIGALIVPCLAGSLLTILLAKHPRITPHALDPDGMFRLWVARGFAGGLSLGFVAISVAAALSDAEGGLVVAVIAGVLAAIFVFLLVKAWGGNHRIHGELFGIRLTEPPPDSGP